MKPQKQLISHDPDNGQWGDCERTCYAILLDMDAKDVPHFCDKNADATEVQTKVIPEWLNSVGFEPVRVAWDSDIKRVLEVMAYLNPFQYYLLGCKSAIANHSVVCCGGEIVCNPSTGLPDVDTNFGNMDDGNIWTVFLAPVSQTSRPKLTPADFQGVHVLYGIPHEVYQSGCPMCNPNQLSLL